jgi:hypothetical protein
MGVHLIAYTSQACTLGMHLIGMHLIGVYLTGVHLTGVYHGHASGDAVGFYLVVRTYLRGLVVAALVSHFSFWR